MTREIQPADRGTRRAALRWVIAIIAVAVLIVAFGEPLTGLAVTWAGDPASDRGLRFGIIFLALGIAGTTPVIVIAGYLFRQAAAVLRTDRFPPPGQRIYRNSPIFQGRQARIRARLIQLLGLGLIAAAGMLGFYLVSLWRVLFT